MLPPVNEPFEGLPDTDRRHPMARQAGPCGENGLTVWKPAFEIWIAETAAPRAPPLADVLSGEEKERCNRFHRQELRDLYITAHALKRLSIADRLGAPDPRTLRFAAGARGKPVLRDAPLHFNLSHSRGVCAVALSQHGPCGVDVEAHDARRNFAALMKAMTASERKLIQAAEHPQVAFVQRWVIKEAYSKFTGLGLAERFDRLCTECELRDTGGGFGSIRNTCIYRTSFPHYSIAACVAGLPLEPWTGEVSAAPETSFGELTVRGYQFSFI